jgi:hypothetical protein
MSALFDDFEQPIHDLNGLVRLLGHLADSKREKLEDELALLNLIAHRIHADFEAAYAAARSEDNDMNEKERIDAIVSLFEAAQERQRGRDTT